MASAWFRFYEELNDFLPPTQRKVEFEYRFDRRASIKDMIESLGVPHRSNPLARYLRLLGFDCLYRNDYRDADVARISQQQHRIVLTRDRRLLQHKVIDHGLYVRSTRPKDQVREVLQRLDLHGLVRPFTRCTRCNGSLGSVPKEAIDTLLQPKTRRYYNAFRQCPDCKQVYWQGSHHTRMLKLIEEFLEPPSDIPDNTRV